MRSANGTGGARPDGEETVTERLAEAEAAVCYFAARCRPVRTGWQIHRGARPVGIRANGDAAGNFSG